MKEEDGKKDRNLRKEEKKQRSKTLREQDITWEQLRREEMGNGAKMGPTTSPVKRSKELQEEGDGVPKERRRKKLKHEVLGAGWGEQGQAQGAPQNNVEPQYNGSPTIAREQEPTQEAPHNSMELHHNGSPAVPREQRLKQRRMSEYLNPGATEPPGSTQGWSTTDNVVASPRTPLSSLTGEAGGGSPWGQMNVDGTEECRDGSPFVNANIPKNDDKLRRDIVLNTEDIVCTV